MKTYEVITTCTFQRRYWEKGSIAEFADDVAPPRHFKLLKGDEKPAPKETSGPASPSTLSELQKQQNEATKPKAGFAKHTEEYDEPYQKKQGTQKYLKRKKK
jgi:hypothetical protein